MPSHRIPNLFLGTSFFQDTGLWSDGCSVLVTSIFLPKEEPERWMATTRGGVWLVCLPYKRKPCKEGRPYKRPGAHRRLLYGEKTVYPEYTQRMGRTRILRTRQRKTWKLFQYNNWKPRWKSRKDQYPSLLSIFCMTDRAASVQQTILYIVRANLVTNKIVKCGR